MTESIYSETREKMTKTVTTLENELKKVRTGRASLNLLDGIRADYYGTLTPLNHMAFSISLMAVTSQGCIVISRLSGTEREAI